MNNNEINQEVVNRLADLVYGSKLLKVYEYTPRSCNGGAWLDGSVAVVVGDKVAEQLGIDSPVTYIAQSHEDLVINAALVQINMSTGEANFVTDGTQIIQFSILGEQVIFGLSGGYDNRVFTLLRGNYLNLFSVLYGGGFTACNSPDVQTFLIISDKMQPQFIAM